MRVLFFTQYFAPEVGATQSRTFDMSQALLRAGHDVTLICEVPNHPAGRIWPEYRGRVFTREQYEGLDVLRVWVKASPSKSYGGRLGFYASYMVMAAAAALLMARGRYDVVFSTSPPLLVGASGLFTALWRRLPFVFEVRDPWPEAAVALGELRDGMALRLARWLERQCYRRAAKVITVSDGWRRQLLSKGVPENRIAQIANGANTDLFSPQPAAGAALREALGLPADAFVVLYAGLHGLAQGLESVIEAAARLRDEDRLCFVFAGDGPAKPTLMQQAKELDLSNVTFVEPVPRDQAAALFSMADAALVPVRRNAFLHGMLPAKTFDALACGTPLIAAAEGELRELVEQANGGVCVNPEDPDALARAILDLRGSPQRCREMGESGLRFVRSHYNRETQADAFVKLLETVAAEEPAS